MKNSKIINRKKRHARVRTVIKGTKQAPRLAVFRSNKHIYAQLIDDDKGSTLVVSSDINMPKDNNKPMMERAVLIGTDLAKKARIKKITRVVFDRGGFQYAGSIRALAEGARKEGLAF